MLVDLIDQVRDRGVDFGFEGGGQHPASPLGHGGIETGG
jgi:hypothetical protein